MKTPWTEKCKSPDIEIRTVIPVDVFAEKLILKRILAAKAVLDARGDGAKTDDNE